MTHHSDTMFGDFCEQINCWLPLTRCRGSNALQCASFDRSIDILARFCADFDFDPQIFRNSRDLFYSKSQNDSAFQRYVAGSCASVDADYGELLMFDARLIHGTAENQQNETRVSLDFRILPLSEYERIRSRYGSTGVAMPEHCGLPMLRGAFYDQRSAYEL